MPFVLLLGDEVIASGPTSDFGRVASDERVEFRASGAAWDEADRLKDEARRAACAAEVQTRKARKEALGGDRLVFAFTAVWRYAAHRHGGDVVAYPASKRIGSMAGLRGKRKGRIEHLHRLGDAVWLDVPASAVLVALDEWREAGCPRRKWKRLGVGSGPARDVLCLPT
jgi:hypothetical protein